MLALRQTLSYGRDSGLATGRQMTRKRYSLVAVAVGVLLATAPAHAATIGTSTAPAGTSPGSCGPGVIGQWSSDPAMPYEVPAGGGRVTQWQLNTSGGNPGDQVTFVLLRPNSGRTAYNVVGTDTEPLPNPLPAVASFNVATPIPADAGDTMGVFAPSSSVTCYFQGGSLSLMDQAMALGPSGSSTPAPGQTLPVAETGSQIVTNVAATIQQSEDVAVTAAAGPAGAAAGSLGQLSALVTNGGVSGGPVTVVDNVPAGLAVNSAVAGGGTCSVAGQTVTCAIASLAPGASVPVVVTVVPTHAGSYANTFSATPASFPDPNLGNNNASATLSVGPAVVPVSNACVVPPLGGVSLRVAKRILRALHCKPGKVSRAHSRKVPRGAVIRTTPSTGDFAAGKKVNLTISSGKAKKKKRHGH